MDNAYCIRISPGPSAGVGIRMFQLLTEDATPKLPTPGLQKRYFKRYLYKYHQLYYHESQKQRQIFPTI